MSLVPVMKDPDTRIRDHAYHAYPLGGYIGRAIRTERYRLVEWKNWENPSDIVYELYDYEKDPLETVNIADRETVIVDKLKQILYKHPEPKRIK